MQIQTVTVYGCGTIGSGWAAFYASKGLNVRLWDMNEAARIEGRRRALSAIDFLAAQKLCDAAVVEHAKDRFVVSNDAAAAPRT
jgi:carnitine 3-dehydrogenase